MGTQTIPWSKILKDIQSGKKDDEDNDDDDDDEEEEEEEAEVEEVSATRLPSSAYPYRQPALNTLFVHRLT